MTEPGVMKDVNALFGMVDHYHVEAMAMRWRKRDLWKAGIIVAGMLLLLVLMIWAPVSAAGAHQGVSEPAMPGTVTVQATPTEDATVTALNKEKLAQEVQQLKSQNEPDPLGWLRTNASILLSTLVVVIGGLIGLFRWLGDRRDEQEKRREDQRSEQVKRAEERFQAAVTGLGDEREGARIGAAILLRTFLRPGYEQFYTQTFDLAVANLRLPRTSHPPQDADTPLPLTSLSQALIVIFKEAFPLARSQNQGSTQSLDATGVQLDSGNLRGTDLQHAWMRRASLRDADLFGATLSGARLFKADLRQAWLWKADLRGADLRETDFRGADLREANLSKADLREANLDWTSLEEVLSLEDTNLLSVKGLTKEQLAICQAKGAIIDEDPTTSSPSSIVAPPSPPQSNDTQASSAPPAQGSLLTPDTGGSSATSSQQDSEA